MELIYREIKVTNGDGIKIPDNRVGDVNIAQREDGAYVYWMEYGPRMISPILNEVVQA